MNAVHEALVETVEYLMTLADDGSRPRDARARLRLLQEQYPEVRMDLLWEEEPFDASVHYDVLLSLSTVRTVSVGLSPDRALPWPLRGVHRWSEQNLVRVNHTALEVGQAIACLDFIWDEAPIIDRLVDLCLIQEALERDPITLSDAELQEAMDGFRRAKRLYTAAATYHWLESHGMTQQKLEEYVGDQAIVAKLRRRVAAGRVDTYFAAHHADFDTARIARIDFATEADAAAVAEQIHTGTLGFYAAAEQCLQTAGCPDQPAPVTFAVLQRGTAPVELAAAVFRAAAGALLPPIRTGDRYALVRVLARTPARLDASTRPAVEHALFREWLDERRRAATIEWYWGNAARTAAAGPSLDEMRSEHPPTEARR